MARKRKKTGICCICGKQGPMSFEHVPPRAAFNKETVIAYSWEKNSCNRKSKAKPIQGGIGAYTLCQQCNNDTGSWYGSEYVKWARTCHDIAKSWRKFAISSSAVTLPYVRPSRFLKQIFTCCFSTLTGPGTNALAQRYPDLKKFVLERDYKELPEGFRFFMNLYLPPPGKAIFERLPGVGKLSIVKEKFGIARCQPVFFFPITHPPFQLIMTKHGQDYPGATEITHFKDYDVDQKIDIRLQLRLFSSSTTFRTR